MRILESGRPGMQSGSLAKISPSIFLNLTNGLEFLNDSQRIGGFVRIQSTACEQKRWWPIILDLDYTFLIHVGLGHAVCVCDASAKKQVPRALYQGISGLGMFFPGGGLPGS